MISRYTGLRSGQKGEPPARLANQAEPGWPFAEQAALLLHHGYTAEAEQAFRIATEIAPASPEAVFRYINLLVGQKRFDEALPIAETAVRADVNNQQQFGKLLEELARLRQIGR